MRPNTLAQKKKISDEANRHPFFKFDQIWAQKTTFLGFHIKGTYYSVVSFCQQKYVDRNRQQRIKILL
jgi:hypothetical protein